MQVDKDDAAGVVSPSKLTGANGRTGLTDQAFGASSGIASVESFGIPTRF